MTTQGDQPSPAAILEEWDAIVLGCASVATELTAGTTQARARLSALELHVELLDVVIAALHAVAAESLDRTVSAWELLSSRLPAVDGLDALLVEGLTYAEHREAVALLADELFERRTDCQGTPESSRDENPRSINPTHNGGPMSEQPASTPTPQPSEKARAWAREQIEKHGPPPQHLVDHVNRLRREYAEKLRKEDEEGHVE